MARIAVICIPVVLLSAGVHAQVVIETVTVGNPGNPPDTRYETPGYGGVDYSYNIGKFEVTAGQYTDFLNAVAAEDTYGVYNEEMWTHEYGCKIERTGLSPDYSYSVAGDWADRPVNLISWGDAARFCNWLHNGQPTGVQDLTTTEDGSYYLNGATTDAELIAVVRKEDATWVIPSEDEWYKAAYHYNDGATANYYDYPTSSDSVPSNDLVDPDPGNNANFYVRFDDYTIGSPYFRSRAGDFENSESPYGTFDQGGNAFEWNEAVISGSYRGRRGGSSFSTAGYLRAVSRSSSYPTLENYGVGFRVARVPERGDYDVNGTVNLADYAEFPGCLTGPEVERDAQCEIFDFDFDLDVDLADFTGFQRVCTSPPGMVFVPAGEFEMGDPWSEGDEDERPVHTVYLSPYYIDKYEVTNEQYAAALNWAILGGWIFVGADDQIVRGMHNNTIYCDTTASSAYSRITWDGSIFGVVSGKENHPMLRVSWYGSVAYCNWRSAMEGKPLCYDLSTWTCGFGVAGYRLPTEAEWEKASGWDPVQERHFRFGEHTDGCGYNCLDGHRAAFYSSGGPYGFGEDPPVTAPVGFYNGELHYKVDFGWPGSQTSYQTQDARSYYGCYDMSGNAWEWCNDWYDERYYDSSPYSNPQGPAGGTERVLRGGGWHDVPRDCRSAYREGRLPGYRYYAYGFRCSLGTP